MKDEQSAAYWKSQADRWRKAFWAQRKRRVACACKRAGSCVGWGPSLDAYERAYFQRSRTLRNCLNALFTLLEELSGPKGLSTSPADKVRYLENIIIHTLLDANKNGVGWYLLSEPQPDLEGEEEP